MFITKIVAAVAVIAATAGIATAQNWPTRPVTLVVPFAAGSASDTVARILGARLSEVLGQQVIIENVGGAGGMTGASRVAKAAPDGYQFVLGGIDTFAQNQTLYKRPLYNAATDFSAVALVVEQPLILLARNDLPVGNLQAFIAYAKENHTKCSMALRASGPVPISPVRSSMRRSALKSPTFRIAARRRPCRI